jgi:hypothetical protein
MTRKTRRLYLSGIALFSILMAVLFLVSPGLRRNPGSPDDVTSMARWLGAHPADWVIAGAFSGRVLDSTLPQRVELWRTAYSLSQRLAPRRPNPAASFVRGGLFHWYELGADDRRQILKTAAPLLSDPRLFGALHLPLFDLTRDFAYLQRNAPRSADALRALSHLAVTHGLFAEYRSLRGAQRIERWNTFQRARDMDQPAELLALLPEHLDAQDTELARSILEELDQRPLAGQSTSRRAEDLALFAMRHRLQPLTALARLIEIPGTLSEPTRARLALALGNPALASKVELTSSNTLSPAWVPYQLERAVFEARNGDPSVAEAYLMRTIGQGIDDRILTSAEEVARLKGDMENASRFHRELLAAAKKPRVWLETCGTGELCTRAITRQYVAETKGTIRVTASRIDSAGLEADPVPPYVEVYVDDALVGEGPVGEATVFEAQANAGLHRIEVRLVNRLTRNGIQRRVRLS